MITLATTQSIAAKAGTASAITYSVNGDAVTTSDAFQLLSQGTVATSAAAIYTVPASTQALVKGMHFANVTASPVTLVLYQNGLISTNQIFQATIPANGTCMFDSSGWHVYDANGSLQFSTGGILSVSAVDSSISIGGTATAPTFKLGALPATAAPTWAAGKLVFDSDNDCPTFFNSDSGISLQLGQENWIRVKNVTGSTISNGQAVYISGNDATTGLPTVALAQANVLATAQGIAVTTESIANNAIGFATILGIVHTLNTNAFTSGQALYLSATTPGGLTNTVPTGTSQYSVRLGFVGVVSATVGTLYVCPEAPDQYATTSQPGYQSALDKKKQDNDFYDVTANAWATLVGDDATDNTSAWATFFTNVPAGSTVFFPGGTFRGNFIINADKHLRIRGAGKYTTTIKAITALADPSAFHVTTTAWYNSFEDMAFAATTASVTTVGINIDPGAAASAVGTNIYRCSFNGMGIGVRAVGSQAANLSIWDSLDISVPQINGARGLLINGNTINLVCSNSTINGTQATAFTNAGIEINQSGAIQLVGGDFIGAFNTLLLNANQGASSSVAAVFATNCFFDQSGNSTVKITGANVVNRVKFVQCGITGGNVAGASAVEIASTGTGAAGTATAAADGIDFFDCDIYPNGGSGTINGFLITGAQGVSINSCRISGWTNGVAITPAVAAGYTKLFMNGNKMGATNNFTTVNTTGLLINAGSFAYGILLVDDNDFTGSTTPIVNNSLAGGTKQMTSNLGLASPASAMVATPATIAATETVVHSVPLPANALLVGTTLCIVAAGIETATTPTLLAKLHLGTAGTTADAVVCATPAVGVTTATGWMVEAFVTIRSIGSGGTCVGNAIVQGTAPGKSAQTATVAVNTTVANILTLSLTGGGTTPVVTVVNAYSQVINQ